ncbi:uncharacterized protein K02A2.6-like [Lucilia sericata]|uniref:uncharacterized protein K02A2.6-like n=1 Tax=Lucilia sericata TaxID=13632 RepID=UPI0018A84E6F|nr:uncharacterized protein K02A2.6-like [Lucilia sericata]
MLARSKLNGCHSALKLLHTIKSDVTSDQVLVHFNPQTPIVLTTDASDNAIAGVLSHNIGGNLRPISYVSASARMQRWSLILSGFNYSVEYIKGDSNSADGLSRMPQQSSAKDIIESNYINLIESDDKFAINFKTIARETRRDLILSKVCESVRKGKVNVLHNEDFTPYINKCTELSVEYDCLLWGYRVIIPMKLRKVVLNQLHESHLGIVKTKAMARSYVWWPGIDKDIENMIKSCTSCQQLLDSPEKSSLIPWTPTDSVWSRIHVDFAGPINGVYLFIVIDSFSKFAEVFLTKEITTSFTVAKLRELFC